MRYLNLPVMLVISALVLGLAGCDAPDKDKSSTSEPVAEDAKQPAGTAQEALFRPGQTIDQVRQLLGKPSGTIINSNQTFLLYGPEVLRFVDGSWVNCQPDIRERIEAGKKAAAKQAADAAKQAADAAKQAAAAAKQAANRIRTQAPAAKSNVSEGQPAAVRVESEYSELLAPGRITVVDFYATWCAPCRHVAPILESLVNQNPDVVLRKVDIGDWGSSIVEKYHITSVPSIRVFDQHGRKVGSPTSNPNQVALYIEKARRSQ